jgi:hypothetical protein
MIITRPLGNTSPLMILTMPGAFSCSHGEAVAINEAADAKQSRHPAEKAEKKILSGRILPLLAPMRETSSMVSAGVYDARLATWTVCVAIVVSSVVGMAPGGQDGLCNLRLRGEEILGDQGGKDTIGNSECDCCGVSNP